MHDIEHVQFLVYAEVMAESASKSDLTRTHIADTALGLFRERGYDKTTMRLIASEAGVSQGNAYYYFDGKDALVQELYARIQRDHRDLATPLLTQGAPLADNLRIVWHAGVDIMTPYHSFGSTMLATALSTSEAVSPFSDESAAPREAATSLMADLLAASKGTHKGQLAQQLPHLLWLAYLGVTLHWVMDSSPDQRRTRDLVDGLAPIVARTVGLARLPVARGLTSDIVALTERVTKELS